MQSSPKSYYSQKVTSALSKEAIITNSPPQSWSEIITDPDRTNAALSLTGIIPHHHDPRWPLIDAYHNIRPLIKRSMFRSALTAAYNGEPLGQWGRYGKLENLPTIIQHARAVINLSQIPHFRQMFESPLHISSSTGLPVTATYQPTESRNYGQDQFGRWGCPEAVHQIQAWVPLPEYQTHPYEVHSGQVYAGRVGLNIHRHDEEQIITIANIHGSDATKWVYDRHPQGAVGFFLDVLHPTLRSLFQQNNTILHGHIPRSPHGVPVNQPMYYMVFRQLGIKKSQISKD